jgi:hypothetical protein
MSLLDVHSDATAGIVEALSKAEAMRTAILVMNAAPLVWMLRRFLSFCLAVLANDVDGS